VLEHLCWLADELGESEIVCPIVEYAAQLIPQLKHKVRSSKISKRSSVAPILESDSDSYDSFDEESDSTRPPSSPKMFSVSSHVASQSFSHEQNLNSPNRSKLSFRSVLKAANIEKSAKLPDPTVTSDLQAYPLKSDSAPSLSGIPSYSPPVTLASQVPKSASASRIAELALDLMKIDLAREGIDAPASLVPPKVQLDKTKSAGLLAILAASALQKAGNARAASRSLKKVDGDDSPHSHLSDIELTEAQVAPLSQHSALVTNEIELEVNFFFRFIYVHLTNLIFFYLDSAIIS